ncbi:MAG TPA: response regulator transcription factor [Candidatus Dormibacteraeota bacterium]|nr:response regulator transcription factor [Candidatus Dormibacteraeota bacterium]
MTADDSAAVLIVEDDRPLRETISSAVSDAGYAVTAVADGVQGTQALRAGGFDVVLLDIGLPFVDGWTVLQTLEGQPIPSVIVISARGDEQDKVRALDMGADDYLAKPFGADELLARLRAVLRRSKPELTPNRMAREGDVVVDLGSGAVLRAGKEVRLSPTEYVLLAELARHHHEVLDYRTLLQRVWGPSYADERNYLRTFVQRLRVKLEVDPAQPRVITTASGRGYRFGGPPEI